MANYSLSIIAIVIAVVAVIGWISISSYTQEAAATNITSSSEAKVSLTGLHCTASMPCHLICGNHMCAPGEVPKPP
ncbi:MAG: hypothetical protein WBV92_08240 [Nitrosotalea sp.]